MSRHDFSFFSFPLSRFHACASQDTVQVIPREMQTLPRHSQTQPGHSADTAQAQPGRSPDTAQTQPDTAGTQPRHSPDIARHGQDAAQKGRDAARSTAVNRQPGAPGRPPAPAPARPRRTRSGGSRRSRSGWAAIADGLDVSYVICLGCDGGVCRGGSIGFGRRLGILAERIQYGADTK